MNNFMQCILAASTVVMTFTNPLLAEETRTVLDQRGVAVEVPKEVKRMVVFPGPIPSVVYAIDGSTKSIVGAYSSSIKAAKTGMMATMAPDILDAKTDFMVGRFGVNLEELLALNPDVIIQWTGQEALEAMETAGLPVIGLSVMGKGQSQAHFEEWLRILGEIFDKKERANQLLTLQRGIISEMKTRVDPMDMAERPRILLINKLVDGFIEIRGGENDHHYFWITGGGGKSVAKELAGGRHQVNMEQILAWNPEVIYIRNWNDLTPQDLYDNKIPGQDWSKVSAVENRRVYKIPLGVYVWSSPNAERALMLKWTAKRNFPEKFADLDMAKIVKDFYDEFFGYDLSEAEIKKILHSEMNGEM